MEVHAMSDDGHPDDIELPDGPLRLLAASNELDALQRMLRGDQNNAVAALKAMDYAELYCLRIGLERLHKLTCERLEKVR